jgi:uncharacterized membrane protein
MRTAEFFLPALNILLVTLVFHFVPKLRKRSLFFGVTVDEAFRRTDAARNIGRTYRQMVWTGGAVAIALLWLALRLEWRSLIGLPPLLQVAVAIAAWVIAWRRARPHATTRPFPERAVTLGEAAPSIPGGIAAILLPFAGPAAAAWHLWSRYDQLPARYPVHWNAAGQADRFADKSFGTVFFPPMMSAAVLMLMAVIAFGIQYGGRRGSSGERAGWSARHRRLNLLLLVCIMWLLSAMMSLPSFGALIPPETMRVLVWSSVGLLLATVVGFLIPLIRMSTEATGGTDATPDECWRWGTIYYNPNDPAFMVEKRDGPGFTINFGNRLSWALVVLIAAITLAPIVFAAGS